MAKMKQPHVKISAGFYLKNAPKGQLGLRHEHWTFGDEPCSLDKLVFSIVQRLCDFYVMELPVSADDVNEQLERVGNAIAALKFEEHREGKAD